MFTPGSNLDRNGEDKCQTPIWIRPKSLGQSMIAGVHQVVGHTSVEYVSTFPKTGGDTTLTLADTIGSKRYVIIEDYKLREGIIE